MVKGNYNELTLNERAEVLEEIRKGSSCRKISEKFKISIGTVSGVKKQKEEIENRISRNANPSQRRPSRVTGNALAIDVKTFEWFCATRSKNLPASGPLIQEFALRCAKVLDMNDFKASNGWLQAFQKRHNIGLKVLSGESAAMDNLTVENWKNNVKHVLAGYSMDNVWNIDETGLFWKGLPNKTLAIKSEEAKGGKLAKERLTVCCLVSQVTHFDVLSASRNRLAFRQNLQQRLAPLN